VAWTGNALRLFTGLFIACAAGGIFAGEQKPLSDQVRFDPDSRRVTTDVYDYIPAPVNPFVFQRIDFNGAVAVEDAGLDLFFKPKNFFDIHLDETDLTGRVRQAAVDGGQVFLDLDFLLRFLFFRIDVDVSTAAVFSRDRASMPLTFKVPVNSKALLMAGSGAFYSWSERSARITDQGTTCSDRSCTYLFTGKLLTDKTKADNSESGKSPRFAVRMSVGRDLVAQGFVPELIRDHRVLTTSRGWPATRERWGGRGGSQHPDAVRTGIYFELSGLGKGTYRVDYDIGLLPQPTP
jgi:hypothetical protein